MGIPGQGIIGDGHAIIRRIKQLQKYIVAGKFEDAQDISATILTNYTTLDGTMQGASSVQDLSANQTLPLRDPQNFTA